MLGLTKPAKNSDNDAAAVLSPFSTSCPNFTKLVATFMAKHVAKKCPGGHRGIERNIHTSKIEQDVKPFAGRLWVVLYLDLNPKP